MDCFLKQNINLSQIHRGKAANRIFSFLRLNGARTQVRALQMQPDFLDDGLRKRGFGDTQICSLGKRFRQRFGYHGLLRKFHLERLRRIERVDGKLAVVGIQTRRSSSRPASCGASPVRMTRSAARLAAVSTA